MKQERLEHCICPVCKAKLDAATWVGGEAVPEVGDASLCLYCHAKLVFYRQSAEYLGLRLMTDAEFDGLPSALKGVMGKAQTVVGAWVAKHP
jgi:uncharacterized protein YbaR (Trm112 family)